MSTAAFKETNGALLVAVACNDLGSVINFSTEYAYSDDPNTIDALSMLLGFKLAVQLQHHYCMVEGVNEGIVSAIASNNSGNRWLPTGILDAIRDLSKFITSWIVVTIDRQFDNLAFDLALWISSMFLEDE